MSQAKRTGTDRDGKQVALPILNAKKMTTIVRGWIRRAEQDRIFPPRWLLDEMRRYQLPYQVERELGEEPATEDAADETKIDVWKLVTDSTRPASGSSALGAVDVPQADVEMASGDPTSGAPCEGSGSSVLSAGDVSGRQESRKLTVGSDQITRAHAILYHVG